MRKTAECIAAAIGCVLFPCVGQTADVIWPLDRTGFSMVVARKLSGTQPFSSDYQWQSYLAFQQAAQMLWFSQAENVETASVLTEAIQGYTSLVLTDNDGDGQSDFFAYWGDEEDSFYFGAVFARHDSPGHPYWLVINDALVPDFEGGEPSWYTYHCADRNGDGKVDLSVVNNVDFNGDRSDDLTETAWFYDDDHDGLMDRAEYIIDGIRVPIGTPGGSFLIYRGPDPFIHNVSPGESFPSLMQAIMDDVTRAMATENAQ